MRKRAVLPAVAISVSVTLVSGTLAGCAAFTGPQAEQKSVITACNGYASALATAAAFRAQGKLSQSQILDINQAIKVAHPVCSAKQIPGTQAALDKVETATAEIATTNHKVKQ